MPLKNLTKNFQPIVRKKGMLAQVELPAAPTPIYSPPNKRRTEIKAGQLIINNRTNQSRWVTIWYDDDGSDTTDAELVIFELDIPAKGSFSVEVEIFMDNPNGTISIEAENANVLVITIFGTEYINT